MSTLLCHMLTTPPHIHAMHIHTHIDTHTCTCMHIHICIHTSSYPTSCVATHQQHISNTLATHMYTYIVVPNFMCILQLVRSLPPHTRTHLSPPTHALIFLPLPPSFSTTIFNLDFLLVVVCCANVSSVSWCVAPT